jgi:hypothetical protein
MYILGHYFFESVRGPVVACNGYVCIGICGLVPSLLRSSEHWKLGIESLNLNWLIDVGAVRRWFQLSVLVLTNTQS